ncbi:MAG: hydroxyacid dehydrogenase [Proteobacteria bacterium]|nr:hydroxyacid dehydrogenase [Verrucomicrobiota bacterium]NBU10684.1 hydroxyacid dehydrogenase [Pseudomonadota bacterium]
MSEQAIIIYPAPDGKTSIRLRAQDGSVWLTQIEIADLFQTTKQNVGQHIKKVLEEKEFPKSSVVKESFTTAADGKNYRTLHYNLEMILAVGYRVKSVRGTQFRQWATTNLREYLVKGFVMNDERLKNPGGWDYFDELLARIREIRASEKRFYQKVRDLFALSADYKDDETAAQTFFAEVQNKMLYAVTRHTAAELVVQRADPKQPNMGLQSWSGTRVRKQDVIVAKNYLKAEEVDELNRIVVMFLDFAEDHAERRKQLTLGDWRANVGRFLTFHERKVLKNAGAVSHADMKHLAERRYELFDGQRRTAEALEADRDDMKELEEAEKKLLKRPENKGE